MENQNVKSVLTERSGKFSSVRLAFLLWAVGILGVWMYSSIITGEIKPIDQTVVGVLAVLATAKTTQRFGEKEVDS